MKIPPLVLQEVGFHVKGIQMELGLYKKCQKLLWFREKCVFLWQSKKLCHENTNMDSHNDAYAPLGTGSAVSL